MSHQQLKSNRECSTPGQGIFLLPLRVNRRETHQRFSSINKKSPYRFDEIILDRAFESAIHHKEHTARYRRFVVVVVCSFVDVVVFLCVSYVFLMCCL